MEIQYRRLRTDEASKYRALRLESLLASPQSFGKTYNEEASKQELPFEKQIRNQSKNNYVLGAFYGDELVGMCCFNREKGSKRKHAGLLTQMFVKSDHRNKKLGKEILSHIIAEAFAMKELEQIMLGVVAGNEKAHQLYVLAGFEEFGHYKDYWKENGTYLDEKLLVLYKKRWPVNT